MSLKRFFLNTIALVVGLVLIGSITGSLDGFLPQGFSTPAVDSTSTEDVRTKEDPSGEKTASGSSPQKQAGVEMPDNQRNRPSSSKEAPSETTNSKGSGPSGVSGGKNMSPSEVARQQSKENYNQVLGKTGKRRRQKSEMSSEEYSRKVDPLHKKQKESYQKILDDEP